MLSKFSVKKPYTVLVGIVLIIVLGIVSFTNMTTDLLPDINMPYAVVITTYPGASPSQVEEVVSKPVEQAMATVSNIQNVQSISSENMSMVVLEFSQTANMDSVSLEMRENLDQIKGYWDDSVGNPIIMKINPDMMPVMVAAVEKDGLDGIGITEYANQDLISSLESLEGVASVDTSGEVEQSVQVILRQDMIDAVNEKVRGALNGEFADAQAELDDAREGIQDGKAQLEGGKKEMTDRLSQAGSAETQIIQGEAQISQAETQLSQKEQELAASRATLEQQKALLQTGNITKDDMYQAAYAQAYQAALDGAYGEADSQFETVWEQQLQTLRDTIAGLKAAIEMGQAAGQDVTELQGQLSIAEESLAGLGEEARAQAREAARLKAKELLDEAFPSQFDEGYCAKAVETLDGYLAQMDEGQAQIAAAKQQLAQTKAQLSAGKISLAQAQSQIESAKIEGILQMADAQSKLASGEAAIEEGQEKLDQSRETALDAADLKDKITIDTIEGILTAQNFTMPAGYVSEDGIKYLIRVGDKFTNLEEMQNLVLFDLGIDGLAPIRLSDVAEVVMIDNSSEVYAKINGQDGVLLTFQKQTGYSTGEVSDRINDFFKDLMAEDDSVHVTVLMDQGIYIDMVVNSVLQNLGYGAILAVVILFLFLKDIRPTAVVACSIPVSLLTAVVLMYFSGITLNVISLSGLALGVGMLVDNSIVVIENIYRLHGLGIPVRKAAVQGAKQMAGSIVASTLTTICVFAPIIFTEGITRQLFVDMGLTIAYSLLASLAVALTFVPMMASGLLKRPKKAKAGLLDRFMVPYEKAAYWALKHKAVVLLAVLGILIGSMYLCMSKGFIFMPEMESTQASISITMPEGSSAEETGAMADTVTERLQDLSDVKEIGAMAGASGGMMGFGGGSSDTNTATMYLILKEEKELSGEELEAAIAEKTADLNCEVAVSSSMMDMSALGGSGVSVEIKGKDLDKLQEIAKDIAGILEAVEGTEEITDGMEETTSELRMVVNKEKAAKYNLTVAQVFQQIREKLAESTSTTTLSTDTYDYGVRVLEEEQKTYTREDVKSFTITSTKTDGTTEEIPAGELVDFVDAEGVDAIRRDNQTRYITVSANVDDQHNVTLVSDEIKKKLDQYELPEGYSLEMAGEDQTISESMDDLVLMLLLALVFMYLIMVAQFQSLLSPFIVMFTIPLAFTGGFLGLLIAGKEMSVIAMIGFIMLCGIIVNNGIVLVDYINQLRAAGMEKRKAIVTAGKTRMRPILMTALTTILGLVTLAAGVGMGADMTQPMAIVTIGGLVYGTFLTLFVVPCIYDIFNRKKYVVISDRELDADDDELDLMKETNLIAEDAEADEDEEGTKTHEGADESRDGDISS